MKADIGVIGLAVMGQNLILNINDKGFTVAVYNRTITKVDRFLNKEAKGRETIRGTYDIQQFCSMLKRPRKIMLMIKAGKAIDDFVEQLLPFLTPGDVIIDGGNSFFGDTIRRTYYLRDKGINFVGTGISGGEEGARHGPSIMPGGEYEAWPLIKDIFQSICAHTPQGQPCCNWVGSDGAGHYVKMVHNGIEYGDMQLISEAYSLMNGLLKLSHSQMADIFDKWNSTELQSYLIEITARIMQHKDNDGKVLLEKILDKAGQKGTGKWTSVNSLDINVPVTLITEAVYARILSSLKAERVKAAGFFETSEFDFTGDVDSFISDIKDALLASKIISYAQGFMLLKAAAKTYSWKLDFGDIALMWREGCIIRSSFLGKINDAFQNNPALESLLFDPYFSTIIKSAQQSWRKVVSTAFNAGISVPAFASALTFFDSYRSAKLPSNLIQAQRDYFGAHTYERTDAPEGQFFHTNWTGTGGDTSAGSYQV
ncbi:decarboxylating NADP(+)-dependent phosphogluconate dehydrogenase [Chitinispirillales bacterium ANBcel5]|uniref:decarboxylating NADP(+)-dependent phosphogluconate dehydrogenase n=1 Tax=Cellulosispirillum alkaliphilum TaxID=3039283 RepID=UPI002A55B1FB|nr:decarboxylating NADP(+)-dependent phosphogluconate dehydrogenase [Chitinispirillales bacterium ANBcel5]